MDSNLDIKVYYLNFKIYAPDAKDLLSEKMDIKN